MPETDLLYLLEWWIILFSLGILFLPLTSTIFHSFFDRGYALAKILGLLLLGYTVWLAGSLQILPFTAGSIYLLFGLFVVTFAALIYKKRLLLLPHDKLKIFLGEEFLFIITLTFWAFVRAHEPSLHSLEKFMDFGFINSILRSTYFPPKDIWMTPLYINYYYFGHLVTAVLIKASGIYPAIGYNLMLATLFALTATASFSIGANLYYFFLRLAHPKLITHHYLLSTTVLAGGLSAFLVAMGGNLQTIYAFFQNYPDPENPLPFWTLKPMLNFAGYWYPNATRFIPYTIHEFPIYSFVVADLHGHVLNIPFVLLFIALAIKVFYQRTIYFWDYLLIGLLIGTNLMTNVLDGPIYILFFTVLLFVMNLSSHSLSKAVSVTIRPVLLIILAGMIFSLPFWLSFAPFAQGVGVLCAPQFLIDKGRIGPLLFEANHCMRSPFWMLAILWGFPYFTLFGFIFYVLKLKIKNFKLHPSDLLALTFILIATILIMIPEFFYAKDIYPTYYRANTVFKFGYQAFIIFALTSGYMTVRIFTQAKRSILYSIFFFAFFFLVAIYPYFAINSFYGGLKNYQGLNGEDYLAGLYPSDYRAILWLQQNIKGQPVILEAQGDSYTDFARVSANTGLPTVLGWPVHEWLWRGSYNEPGRRIPEVEQLYESTDLNLTKQLISEFNISYVFVGTLERQKYPNLDEAKFTTLGKVVFDYNGTKIYQLYR